MVDQPNEQHSDELVGRGGGVLRVSRAEDGPESGWPAWPVTVAIPTGGQLTVAMGQYLPAESMPTEQDPEPEDRLLAGARTGVPVEVVNALKDLYERALPVWVSVPVTQRLMKVYIHLREQGVPVDPLPPADEAQNEDPNMFVQGWLRGMVLAMNPAQDAELMLARYVVSIWQDAATKTGESIEALVGRGGAGQLTLGTLAAEQFARRTEPWLVEQIWGMAACVVESLDLHRASPRDVEQLLGLRPVAWAEMFAYRDAGPIPDTAPTA
jgi:hypothetical protein